MFVELLFGIDEHLAGHFRYYKGIIMAFLGKAVVIVVGGSINIGRCSYVEIGFSKDIMASTSPNIGRLLS